MSSSSLIHTGANKKSDTVLRLDIGDEDDGSWWLVMVCHGSSQVAAHSTVPLPSVLVMLTRLEHFLPCRLPATCKWQNRVFDSLSFFRSSIPVPHTPLFFLRWSVCSPKQVDIDVVRLC